MGLSAFSPGGPLPTELLPSFLAAGAAGLGAWSTLVEPAWVEFSEHALPLPDAPPDWIGRLIVHLTDLHYGDPRSNQLFDLVADRIRAWQPDLVLITGDYVLRHHPRIEECARRLEGVRASRGVYGVLGDHDYSRLTQEPHRGLTERLQQAGIRLLRNEQVTLPGGLLLAGVDPRTVKLKRSRVRDAIPQEAPLPHILMAHAPDIVTEIAEMPIPLVLCGHTHGGQVVLPGWGPILTHSAVDRRHASGWSTAGRARVYTGRGLASHASLRFWCRPEIARFRIEAACGAS
jgi:hypothetical protein